VLERLLEAAFTALPEIEASEEVVVAGLRRRDEQRVENVLTLELLVPGSWSDALRRGYRTGCCSRRACGLDARRFDVRVTVLDSAREVAASAAGHRCAGVVADAALAPAAGGRVQHRCRHRLGLAVGRVCWRRRSAPMATCPVKAQRACLLASQAAAHEGDARLWRPSWSVPSRSRAAPGRTAPAAGGARHPVACITLATDGAQAQFVLHDADHRGDLMVDAAAIAARWRPTSISVRRAWRWPSAPANWARRCRWPSWRWPTRSFSARANLCCCSVSPTTSSACSGWSILFLPRR
jgi:hypothetical protein